MKKLTMFMLRSCPYCIQADAWTRELTRENPAFAEIEIQRIDESEQAELANRYDYYYVPTYYLDGVKLHEGAATKEKIRAVLEAALGQES